jgi:hypothetical protein
MNQLDAATRQALCRGDQPPAGVEDRILAAILPPLVPPGGPPEGSGGSPGSLGLEQGAAVGGGSAAAGGAGAGGMSLAYAVKVVAATLGIAAGGVGLLAVTAQGVRALGAAGAEPHVSVVAPVTAAPTPAPARSEPPLADLDADPSDPDPDPSEPEPDPGLARVKPVTSSPKPSATGSASAPGVEAELALIQRARATSEPDATLALLRQHAERFPDGVFAAEREVLRVEQLCALGRPSEAEAIAASFLARRPQHPLRARIQPACPKQNQP